MSQKHKCPGCGETKRSQFWRNTKKGPDGLQTFCKSCAKENRKRWAELNPDRVQSYQDRNYKKLRGNKQAWDSKLKQQAAYRRKHRYHTQVAWNNHRCRKAGRPAKERIKTKEWIALVKEHRTHCPGCKQLWALVGAATIDHIRPLLLKGKNLIENVQPLCRSCNSNKSARLRSFIQRKKMEQSGIQTPNEPE